MRWQELFDDLEAQFEAATTAELAAEVADRTRRELGLLALTDRLAASIGGHLVLTLAGAGNVRGRLRDTGPDWLLLELDGVQELLVPTAAVLGLTGLTARTRDSGAQDHVAKRLDLRWALRSVTRSRAAVSVVLVDGSTVTGTLDRIGADHLDLAEHAPGELRRAAGVRQVRTVPLAALAAVRS